MPGTGTYQEWITRVLPSRVHIGKAKEANNKNARPTSEQREREASIYVYVIRKALGKKVGMGDVKRMKHYPHVI